MQFKKLKWSLIMLLQMLFWYDCAQDQ